MAKQETAVYEALRALSQTIEAAAGLSSTLGGHELLPPPMQTAADAARECAGALSALPRSAKPEALPALVEAARRQAQVVEAWSANRPNVVGRFVAATYAASCSRATDDVLLVLSVVGAQVAAAELAGTPAAGSVKQLVLSAELIRDDNLARRFWAECFGEALGVPTAEFFQCVEEMLEAKSWLQPTRVVAHLDPDLSGEVSLCEFAAFVAARGGMVQALRECSAGSSALFSWGSNRMGECGFPPMVASETSSPKEVEVLRGRPLRQLACDGGVSACVLESGEVYTWGSNSHAKLGHGASSSAGDRATLSAADAFCSAPRKLEALSGQRIVQLSVASTWMAAVSESGALYTWGGYSAHARHAPTLGHVKAEVELEHGDGGTLFLPRPTRVQSFQHAKVSAVCCSTEHALAITSDGQLHSWGGGERGKLGLGSVEDSPTPRLVVALKAEAVVAVACGAFHSMAVTRTGKLYVWGSGKDGKLGLGEAGYTRAFQQDGAGQPFVPAPACVGALTDERVVGCAAGASHSAALTAAGEVYTFGAGKSGALGHGGSSAEWLPRRVASLEGVKVLDAGREFTAAVCQEGDCWMFGTAERGVLGVGKLGEKERKVMTPRLLLTKGMSSRAVTQVSCGRFHAMAIGGAAGSAADYESTDKEKVEIVRIEEALKDRFGIGAKKKAEEEAAAAAAEAAAEAEAKAAAAEQAKKNAAAEERRQRREERHAQDEEGLDLHYSESSDDGLSATHSSSEDSASQYESESDDEYTGRSRQNQRKRRRKKRIARVEEARERRKAELGEKEYFRGRTEELEVELSEIKAKFDALTRQNEQLKAELKARPTQGGAKPGGAGGAAAAGAFGAFGALSAGASSISGGMPSVMPATSAESSKPTGSAEAADDFAKKFAEMQGSGGGKKKLGLARFKSATAKTMADNDKSGGGGLAGIASAAAADAGVAQTAIVPFHKRLAAAAALKKNAKFDGPDASLSVVKEGWLQKQSGGKLTEKGNKKKSMSQMKRHWDRRYFVLFASTDPNNPAGGAGLFYYQDQDAYRAKTILGRVALAGMVIERKVIKNKKDEGREKLRLTSREREIGLKIGKDKDNNDTTDSHGLPVVIADWEAPLRAATKTENSAVGVRHGVGGGAARLTSPRPQVLDPQASGSVTSTAYAARSTRGGTDIEDEPLFPDLHATTPALPPAVSALAEAAATTAAAAALPSPSPKITKNLLIGEQIRAKGAVNASPPRERHRVPGRQRMDSSVNPLVSPAMSEMSVATTSGAATPQMIPHTTRAVEEDSDSGEESAWVSRPGKGKKLVAPDMA